MKGLYRKKKVLSEIATRNHRVLAVIGIWAMLLAGCAGETKEKPWSEGQSYVNKYILFKLECSRVVQLTDYIIWNAEANKQLRWAIGNLTATGGTKPGEVESDLCAILGQTCEKTNIGAFMKRLTQIMREMASKTPGEYKKLHKKAFESYMLAYEMVDEACFTAEQCGASDEDIARYSKLREKYRKVTREMEAIEPPDMTFR